MLRHDRTAIGSVVERKVTSQPSATPRFTAKPGAGFPAVQHRSKSAFARAREEATVNNIDTRRNKISSPKRNPFLTNVEDLRHHISRENEQRLESMTPEEIERERKGILEQLGNDAPELLRRVQEARERKPAREDPQIERPPIHQPKFVLPPLCARPGILRVRSLEGVPQNVPPAVPSQRSCTRPSSRTGKKIRFAEVTPKDIYVYESATSPKRPVLALPPPPEKPDNSITSLGTFTGSIPSKRPHPTDSPAEDKESTVTTTGDSKLEEGIPEYIRRRYFPDAPGNDPDLEWMQSSTSSDSPELRFDLNGAPISPSLSETLPSHLGLHHHAEGNRAGYTLEDLFLLSRSTVPAQHKLVELVGNESEHRKRILATGRSAIGERGGVGVMVVEVVWECLVAWDNGTTGIDGIELHLALDVISSNQPEQLLPIIAGTLSQALLPRQSLEQLLTTVYRFAQESNELAGSIMSTAHLVPAIIQAFLLTPIPPKDDSHLSQRHYRSQLSDSIVLACYGLYSHIATSTSLYFSALGSYVLSPPSLSQKTLSQLRTAWASLLEAWVVCAIDPHATTPPHEILWNQVTAWGWDSEGAVWDVDASWLEGASINGVKGGKEEREKVLEAVKPGFEAQEGLERKVVRAALQAVKQRSNVLALGGLGMEEVFKTVVEPTRVLYSAVRLWLACLSPLQDVPFGFPPSTLPFGELSKFCAELAAHPIWSLPANAACTFSSFLAYFHRLPRHIPSTRRDLWLAQGLSIVTRFIPEDEGAAIAMEENCILPVTSQITGFQMQLLSVPTDILKSFFEYTIRSNPDVYLSPLHIATESICRSTTLGLPGGTPGVLEEEANTGLPFSAHLLSLPIGWDASEADIVRALLLLQVLCGVLQRWGLGVHALGPPEIVFVCMRACMLEHGGVSGMDSSAEVFRDDTVQKLMGWLLYPFTPKRLPTPPPSPPPTVACTETTSCLLPTLTPQNYLELASQMHLRQTRTPFYQCCSDLVALYSTVSLAHPVFGAPLLPPLAMRYPSDYRRLVCATAGMGDSVGAVTEVVRTVRLGLEWERVVCYGWDGPARSAHQLLWMPGSFCTPLNAMEGSL
ncbi:hypothetical protein EDD17DRAFT_1776068 [Pisolithus thermaeus]|nr:hypothetical protein EDD17DRAFT_1776068 [Pisolithus thermaeus]